MEFNSEHAGLVIINGEICAANNNFSTQEEINQNLRIDLQYSIERNHKATQNDISLIQFTSTIYNISGAINHISSDYIKVNYAWRKHTDTGHIIPINSHLSTKKIIY